MPSDSYELLFTRAGRKEATSLPQRVSEQIDRTLARLLEAYNAGTRPQDIKPIQGRSKMYRIDSGEYRALFEVDTEAKTITVTRVRHRKDAYRNI